MADIAGFKRYAVLDPDSGNELPQLCLDAAIEWATDAGIPEREGSAKYDLMVYCLATHFHEVRGNVEGALGTIPPTVFSIMHQLQHAPVPQPKDGGA